MLNISSLLFPTDGSSCARQAYAHATYLADRHGAEVHVLNVVEERTNNLDNLSELIELREADILEQLHIPVPESQRPQTKERIHREKVTNPSAAGGILDYAGAHDIDLIVMGTHGRRGVKRVLIGSVAEEVVRLSTCPVFTVCERGDPAPEEAVNRILVPVDFSKHTAALLQHARELAVTYDAQLDLLHVVEGLSIPSVYGVKPVSINSPDVQERVRKRLDEYAAEMQLSGRTLASHVRSGHPAHEVLDFIDEHAVDLVAIATHGRTGFERLLIGSVAEKVVRMASCPVFAVKSFGKSLVEPT